MSDTNKVLHELRDLFNMVRHEPMHRMRIAELFARLDTALSNGERLPDDWADAIRPHTGRPSVACDNCGKVHYLPLCKTVSKCPGVPHKGHASSDWSCPYEVNN